MDLESLYFAKGQPSSPRTSSAQSSPTVNGKLRYSPIGAKPASPKPGSPVITMSPRFVHKSLQKSMEEMREHIAKLKGELESEKVICFV